VKILEALGARRRERKRSAIMDALERGDDMNARQGMMDSAPSGSVGAPGGVQPLGRDLGKGPDYVPGLGELQASSVVPGLGDITGLVGDAVMYKTQPETRTAGNALMSAAGLLPFVPAAGVIRSVPAPSWSKKKAIEVGENPTFEEFLELLDNTADYGQTRGALRAYEGPDGTAYFWPAEEMLHAEMAKRLGIKRYDPRAAGMVYAEDIAPNWRP